jgi:hypothetical protein
MLYELLKDSLLKEQEKRKDRVRSGKFNPSSFGQCFRRQVWNRLNETPSNPPDLKGLTIFRVGKWYHDGLEAVLPDHQTEVEIDLFDVKGYADIVLEDEVADLKSIREYGFKKIKKLEGDEIFHEKPEDVIQVVFYAITLKKPKARLSYIAKDSHEVKEFELDVNAFRDIVEDELITLRHYWDAHRLNNLLLPKAKPRLYGGNECKYCQFKGKCEEYEDSKKPF